MRTPAWLAYLLSSYASLFLKSYMNKSELIKIIAGECSISQNRAEFALNSMFNAVIESVTADEPIKLGHLGLFSKGQRAERIGRNPKSGETIKVKPTETIKFNATKRFKKTVNGNR